METKKDIEQAKTFTNNQVIRLVSGVAIATFVLTGIFSRFVVDEQAQKTLTERLDKKIKIINGLVESSSKQSLRIAILEKSQSKLEDKVEELEDLIDELEKGECP